MGRTCAACDNWCSNGKFSRNQWMKGDGQSRCKDCVNGVSGPAPRVVNPSSSHTPAPSRTHPQLQALDDLTASGTLTYDGWEEDVREAEGHHLKWPNLFGDYVEGMRLKQALHVGDRSHPQLQALDNLTASGTLTYDGWEDDVREAEDHHLKWPNLFGDYVEGMRLKQAVYVGDRSHPHLQALDNLKRAGLTYIGWEADVRRAEDEEYAFNFADHVVKIQKKQAIYTSQQNARRLAAHESHHVQKRARRNNRSQNLLAETQEKEECVICWSSKKTHAFIPCGHMCVCDGCVASIQDHRCPICRMASQQIVKIFQ